MFWLSSEVVCGYAGYSLISVTTVEGIAALVARVGFAGGATLCIIVKTGSTRSPLPDRRILGREASWFAFFASETLICNAIGLFALFFITCLLSVWTSSYPHNSQNAGVHWYAVVIPWLASCMAAVLGSMLTDWIFEKTGNIVVGRCWFGAGAFLATGVSCLMVPLARSVSEYITLIALSCAFSGLPVAAFAKVIRETARAARIGTNIGFTHFFAGTALILAPMIAGELIASDDGTIIFLAGAVVSAIGMLAMLFVAPGVLYHPRRWP